MTTRWCLEHRKIHQKARTDSWEKTSPDRPGHNLYGTAIWKRMRAFQLELQPLCEHCLRQDKLTPATDVDHIVPHCGDRTAFFDGALQSLCRPCHSSKTQREVNGRRSVF